MKKAVLISVLLLVVLLPGVLLILKPSQPSPPRKMTSEGELDLYLEEISSEGTPPSVSIAVIKDGNWVYKKAFGMADGPRGIPADSETVYSWFSTTKLFTAAAILTLADEGRLSLSDPVRKYLPDFDVVNKEGDPVRISIEQLLNHESGLPDIIPHGLNWIHLSSEADLSQSDFFEQRIREDYRVVSFTPGNDIRYSNTGYIVLGVIIEKVTAEPYEEYIAKTILTPLNLESSSFRRSAELQNRTATASQHRINIFTALLRIYGDRGLMKKIVRETHEQRMWFNPLYTDYTPSTGLSGTSGDLARFGYCLMEQMRFEDGHPVENPLLQAMQRPYTGNELERKYNRTREYGYGLKAWKIRGQRVYGHSGGGPGYAALLAFIPEQNLVVAINANDTSLNREGLLKAIAGINW